MAGLYNAGEQKVRPGLYYRIVNGGGDDPNATPFGTVALALKTNWGPLGEVVTIGSLSEIYPMFGDDEGTGSNTEVIRRIFAGGASRVRAVRVGSGGSEAVTTLMDTDDTTTNEVVTLRAKTPGARDMKVTIKDSLADPTKREFVIHSGTRVVTKVEFAKGTVEASSLVDAINADETSLVTATFNVEGNGVLAALTQAEFTTPGTAPTTTANDYSDALELLEAANWDVLCVDSSETAVHELVKSFIIRTTEAGQLGYAVLSEPKTVPFATRRENAAAFNHPGIVYPPNGGYIADGTLVDGFQLAALIAGMLAALPSNVSPTHKVVPTLVSLAEPLTHGQIEDALQSGCLVLSTSLSGAVRIEQGINTLNVLAENQDSGWKKIRRMKTRCELITRINAAAEPVIGNLNNDSNGRSTFIALANGVGRLMIAESKLQSCNVSEDLETPPKGDSAWFVVDCLDLDSIEKVYITYRFRFSDN